MFGGIGAASKAMKIGKKKKDESRYKDEWNRKGGKPSRAEAPPKPRRGGKPSRPEAPSKPRSGTSRCSGRKGTAKKG